MKKVKMLMDFQGSETKGAFYLKDSEPELEDFIADRLVKDGRAVFVVSVPYANPANDPQYFEEADPPPPAKKELDGELVEKPMKRGKKRGKK